MNSVFIKLTDNEDRYKISDVQISVVSDEQILELRALERWRKWCLQLFSVIFDWIFVKLAVNEDRHKSSNEFEFGPDRIIHFGVIRAWARDFSPIDL